MESLRRPQKRLAYCRRKGHFYLFLWGTCEKYVAQFHIKVDFLSKIFFFGLSTTYSVVLFSDRLGHFRFTSASPSQQNLD